jgi:F-type H+-transporting ATPase subunit epsilon
MAESNLYTVELVTPERVLVDGQASEVILRTGEGDITFLAGHAALIGTVEPGVLRIVRPEGDEERVAVHGGFVQVGPDTAQPDATRVTLLVGVAEPAAEIDATRARAALEAAEAKVAELSSSAGRSGGSGEEEDDPELVAAVAARRRAEIRLETVEAGAAAGPPGGGALSDA